VLTNQMLGDILAHFPDQLSGIEIARRNYMISMFTRHNDEGTLRKNFERIDQESGGTGEIGLLEFHKLLHRLNIPFSLEEVKRVIEENDQDGNGLLNFSEFYSIYTQALMERNQEVLPPDLTGGGIRLARHGCSDGILPETVRSGQTMPGFRSQRRATARGRGVAMWQPRDAALTVWWSAGDSEQAVCDHIRERRGPPVRRTLCFEADGLPRSDRGQQTVADLNR
jgi:Ca2+-binding EF-hand superfamily protein